MKRIVSLLLAIITILTVTTTSLASPKEFDLIEYVENHKIESYSEFANAILENTSREAQSTYMYSLISISEYIYVLTNRY